MSYTYYVFTLIVSDWLWSQPIYNPHYGNGAPAMFTSKYDLNLRGKHCRKPHCRNGVVDTLGLRIRPVLTNQRRNFRTKLTLIDVDMSRHMIKDR